MINNCTKVYKFAYGNDFKKFLCYLIQLMANNGIIIISLAIHFTITQWIMDISNKNTANVLVRFCSVILVVVILFFMCFTFFPRKVVLYDNYIKIHKNAINFFLDKTSFSCIIPYSSIVYCHVIYKESVYKNPDFFRQQAYPCTFFDWNSLVKITDKYGEDYYIPIMNTTDFISEVNKRRYESTCSNSVKTDNE